MSDTKNQSLSADDRQPAAEPVAKKVYEPPRVVSHDALEVITGACSPPGIAKQNTGVCQLGQS